MDLDDDTGRAFNIELKDGGRTATMKLHRLDSDPAGKCRAPKVVNTPFIDAGTVYGSNEEYLQQTLRQKGSCKLKVSTGDLLPVTTKKDPKTGKHLFVAGDPRVNEHAILTTLHTVFVREHNRICDALARPSSGSGGVGRGVDFDDDDDDVDSFFGQDFQQRAPPAGDVEPHPLAMPRGTPDEWFETARRVRPASACVQLFTAPRRVAGRAATGRGARRSWRPRCSRSPCATSCQRWA